MKEVYVERLTKMVELLENVQKDVVKRDRFNLKTWGRQMDCGTVACACGYAGMDSWFNEQGFKLEKMEADSPVMLPTFNSGERIGLFQGWDAVVQFFGLNWSDAQRFFSNDNYSMKDYPSGVGPLDVAARIKEFLKRDMPFRWSPNK